MKKPSPAARWRRTNLLQGGHDSLGVGPKRRLRLFNHDANRTRLTHEERKTIRMGQINILRRDNRFDRIGRADFHCCFGYQAGEQVGGNDAPRPGPIDAGMLYETASFAPESR